MAFLTLLLRYPLLAYYTIIDRLLLRQCTDKICTCGAACMSEHADMNVQMLHLETSARPEWDLISQPSALLSAFYN